MSSTTVLTALLVQPAVGWLRSPPWTTRLPVSRLAHPVQRRGAMHPLMLHGNQNLTIGDFLASVARQQISEELSDRDLAEPRLDAMIDASRDELAALMHAFDRSLLRSAGNTSVALRQHLHQTEQVFMSHLNETAATLEVTLSPSRRAIIDLVTRDREERAAKQRAISTRKANRKAYAKARRAWSREGVVVNDWRSHPVLTVNYVTACAQNALIALIVAAVTASHAGTLPGWVDAHRLALSHYWWEIFGTNLLLYLCTTCIIIAHAQQEEWAAAAVGARIDAPPRYVSNSDGSNGNAVVTNGLFISWEYDWERDVWREAAVSRSLERRLEPVGDGDGAQQPVISTDELRRPGWNSTDYAA